MKKEDKEKTFYELELERVEKEQLSEEQLTGVIKSKLFMDKNFFEKIELKKISASAFMSRFHYLRIFKQVYGITPRQYLRDLRISKAKELLKKGMSVTEVCFEVGYESLTTFSKAFKNGTGLSPIKYQKLNNSNPE